MGKKEIIESWYQENLPSGKAFGYPECCIRAFGNQAPQLMKKGKATRDDKRRLRASYIDDEYTGLIPCSEHAKQIIAGEILLTDLIKNRDRNLPPFPFAY